ncbi:MAG TPA: serine/threonine-protein kinase [Polyangiaceae bacterium]|nr:serine/threonine-protein kinase [Polyangiaceae bacterium]
MVAAKLFDPAAGRQRVDRYELLGEIASGGMATVFLARLTGVGGFQRFVAMKRLHPHLANEAEFVEMFLDEARLAAGIHHPNVVPILEVGASPVGYYLVMEYIEGDTLARMLARAASRGKRIPPSITLRIALDMLAGLHAAHELRDDRGQPINLVHRDVSPQNVLVGGDGISRITDFGVARAASRLSATRVGQLKGKIAYMAPEQAQGDEQLDRRADVFSAGIVIWEALAAKRLFKADNEAATLSRIMSEPVPPLSRVAPHVGKEVGDVIMRALERDRDQRFSSCAQFADELEASASRVKVASSRELAAYVQEVMGEEIARQREAVRTWLARTESLPQDAAGFALAANPSSSVSSAAMSLPDGSSIISHPTLADTPRRSRVPLALLGLVLLLGGGAGGYYGVRVLRHGDDLASAPAQQPARPAAEPVAALKPPDSEPPSAPTAVASAQPAPAPVVAASAAVPPPAAAPAPPPAPAAVRPAARAVAHPRKKKDDAVPTNPYR